MVVTRAHVDVDSETVELEVGMPADTLMRQFEAAGRVKRSKMRRT
jgi:hypothetical protein